MDVSTCSGMRCFLPLVLTSSLTAAVAGVPEAPLPGQLPHFMLGFGNDLIGLGRNRDDYRTTRVFGHGRFAFGEEYGPLHGEWLAVADYSMFTRRGPSVSDPDPGQEGRIDQLTLSLGRLWRPEVTAHQDAWFAVGTGVRVTNDLGGEQLQNRLHDVIGSDEVDLPYEDTQRVDPTLWFSLEIIRTWALGGLGWLPQQVGLRTDLSGLTSTAGQSDAAAAVHGVVRDGPFAIWSGLRYEIHEGADFDPTLATTADKEDGFWYTVGVGMGPLRLEMDANLESEIGAGRISVQRPDKDLETVPAGEDFLGLMVGGQIDHFALVSQLIWSPRWISDLLGEQRRTGIVFGFSGGAVPGSEPDDVRRNHYQATVGLGLRVPTPVEWAGLYGNIRSGWRREGAVYESGGSREEDYRDRAVVAGDLGVHVGLGVLASENSHLGLLLGGTVWAPVGNGSVAVGPQRVELEGAHIALQVGLMASLNY